ncbi:Serine palmitoyltransferase [hydrothermal vent metagenome]|uniref:Serine palmitoyltransferase n=1 Tax=hydrothermal vent metagenome TaxID=652676 RepID=A0A3B0RA91_9ZZZZ
MAIFDKFQALLATNEQLKAIGQSPSSLQFSEILSSTEAILNGRRTILLGTNNYLGMTFDEASIEKGIDALREQGTGTTGSRIANGSYNGHKALEQEIADFYGMGEAMLFSTGYMANLGAIGTLAGRGDYLLIDADSHASIHDACKLSDAEVIRFRHNDPVNLAKKLQRLADKPGEKLIIIESIYSMLGDTSPLKEMIAVKKKYGANLLIDEAHSLGVMGATGRGLCEQVGVEKDIDFVTGTFSKSIGTIGGFLVSNVPGLDIVRLASRPYMFTASLPPSVVATAREALARVPSATRLRTKLWDNATQLYAGLKNAGFELGPQVSPIVAIRMQDAEKAVLLWNGLLEAGIYTNLALPPATPSGWYLLRSSISAAHSSQQIALAVELCSKIGRELGLIPTPPQTGASVEMMNIGSPHKAETPPATAKTDEDVPAVQA